MSADVERLNDALGDRYTLERELGRGGMATVYLAADLKHGRQVAIKVLHPELSVTLGAERFLREIQIEARLNHPHILPLHDSGQADGLLFYVMPYVQGESLRDRLKREGPLPIEDSLQITREVASALDYAHEQGVVHRDIKPENILVSAGKAVVADFGIARAVDEAGSEQLTATGMSVGTPAYMSPEQAAGEKDIDSKTDLYALGCVLYEMLTGEPPFTGPSPQAVMARKVSEPAPGFKDKREGVSEELEAVVLKALARTPDSRYDTAGDFDQALTAGLPRAEWVREGRRSRARALSMGAAAAVLVSAGILWLTNPFRVGAAERPVAIMPIEDRTPEAVAGEISDAWFAEGLAEQIFAALGYVDDVVTGIEEDREKEPQQVRHDLRVRSYVLGSATQMGDLVRVNIRILDSRTGSQLWAKVFDRDLNNIFAVQSEIADSVVIQLVEHGIVPSGQERVVAAAPTENQEALLAYQTGRTQGVIAAAETHARAVALDPGFAWAWAALSAAHVDHLWYNFDRSEGRRDSARNALEQARALAPDDPLVLLAEAYYLDKIERSYAQALELYARVAEARPNDPMVEVYWSSCYRRAGRWTEAAVHRLRAIELNPTQAGNYMELALTYMGLRQYDKANEYFDLSFERGGTNFWIKAANYWLVGQLDSARAMVVEEDRQLGPPEVGGRNGSPITWFWQEYFQREFEDAIHRLEAWDHQLVQDAGYHGPKRLYIGFAYQALGQLEAARAQYDSARVVLEAWLDVPEERNAARTHSDLGIVYALLGRPQEAIEAGERAVEMHVNEHFWGPREIGKLAFIHTILGDYDAALELIEGLLSTDAGHVMSVPLLELDPRWDPLHGHPRYTEIIEEYGG